MEKPNFGINIVDCECWSCHKDVRILFERQNENNRRRVWCEECDKERLKTKKEIDEMSCKVSIYRMLEKAQQILENQGMDMDDYHEVIIVVADAIREKRSSFGSAYEIAAAIELISQGAKVKTQYSVKGYKVDLLLPELKVAVEIDGDRHNYSKQKDAERDIYVHEALGTEWETVRVKPSIIEGHLPDILQYITGKYAKQQKLRAENDGMIPWTHDHNEYTEAYRLLKKLKPLKN